MSILERSPSPQAPAAGQSLRGDRLRLITAGRLGSMETRLGTSGFDVVAVAQTEDALIAAVSADEPDAIVVESDLCVSLEHVRDLAPEAVLIAVGDHTPAGALGRIERGVSGTVMARILHALVAEGVGGALAWGLVPAFGQGTAVHVPQGAAASLASTLANLRTHLPNALRDYADLVTAAGTVVVTVSASVFLTLSGPRTHERPQPVSSPPPAVELAPQHPVFAVSARTRTSSSGLGGLEPVILDPRGFWRDEGKPGHRGRRESSRGHSGDRGRRDDPPNHASRPPGVAYGWNHRPSKHADNGHHRGWSDNSVPEDLPPGSEKAGGRSERTAGPPCPPPSAGCHGE